ncbi:MAG: hypothetical protein BWY29_01086 [Microgenomates group bacterium ADurb.Bin238]|nr:MAG: hypothetical protein BWY29_01086 [Microgenomates group bacterium ADurb.Bin238]
MSKEAVDLATQVVVDAEEYWLRAKWDEYSTYQADPEFECLAHAVLEEIEIEMDRIYPNWRSDEREI